MGVRVECLSTGWGQCTLLVGELCLKLGLYPPDFDCAFFWFVGFFLFFALLFLVLDVVHGLFCVFSSSWSICKS